MKIQSPNKRITVIMLERFPNRHNTIYVFRGKMLSSLCIRFSGVLILYVIYTHNFKVT